ncbi:PREDICTED: probable proline--tRNA ligase, mitochondrial [Polistes canadensis]|uniref:probable proline--tRNA ligase, mitochondrial n=1 Tax=Polistes canadensis TaxID=91411 RepID=UPI000718BCD2|nr:PREDICTED: probable proline--tRNA ligase, mitochondrial [Polistes canadensis]
MASKTFNKISRVSQLFRSPRTTLPDTFEKTEEAVSKGYVNMINNGIIKPVNKGMHVLLPLGFRILNKLSTIVEKEMTKIGSQRILLPALTSTKLFKKTNRYDSDKSELFTLTDRYDREYVLGPTFEEAICSLIKNVGPLTPKILPLKLYQISSKWRDEMKPRLGLLRSREFIMKDLYTFNLNLDDAKDTYNIVCEAYDNIFNQIGIEYIKAEGDTGSIGGCLSHEYHYLSNVGEDTILSCQSCNYHVNKNISTQSECSHCNAKLQAHSAIEVGHTFLLDTKYSKPLNAVYKDQNLEKPLVMGCFGIGLSRIMAAAAEIYSTKEEIKWPKCIAPFTVCIIPPKQGSKEEETAVSYIEPVYDILCKLGIDAILDDRTNLTIGKRLLYVRTTGYPYAIILGKTLITKSVFELYDVYNDKYHEVTLESITDYFMKSDVKESGNILLQESSL